MIDIIIPAYNAHKTIDRTLFSIAYQENIKDINVYIINDKSDNDYSEQVNFFKKFMNITELNLSENSGPGIARQYGIDNSNNPYIIFMDSDDVLAGPSEVQTLYNEIKDNDYDLVVSSFLEQLENNEMVEHFEDMTWVHGKIYKRSFLETNKIRFNNTRYNEDVGFNRKVFLYDSKIKYIDDITYIWCFNKNSLTRTKNDEFEFKFFINYIYNITNALETAINDKCSYKKISETALEYMVNFYFNYIGYMNINNSKMFLKQLKEMKEIYEKYSVKDEKTKKMIIEKRIESFQNRGISLKYISISFDDFINLIQEA